MARLLTPCCFRAWGNELTNLRHSMSLAQQVPCFGCYGSSCRRNLVSPGIRSASHGSNLAAASPAYGAILAPLASPAPYRGCLAFRPWRAEEVAGFASLAGASPAASGVEGLVPVDHGSSEWTCWSHRGTVDPVGNSPTGFGKYAANLVSRGRGRAVSPVSNRMD